MRVRRFNTASTPIPGERSLQVQLDHLQGWLELQFAEVHRKIDSYAECVAELKSMIAKKKSKRVKSVMS